MKSLQNSLLVFFLFALPVSTNYEMHDYGFGGGGVGIGSSVNYSVSGIAGEVSGGQTSGTNYDLGAGLQFLRQSNTPAAPTFTNPANYYNKLQFVLSTGNNPSDTLFAVAVSSDNFVTTLYVQSDGTLANTAVYQTYASWGGGSGSFVIGLSTNTTYKMKVRAVQTKYTESGFSAVASATTVMPSLSYDIDTSAIDTETTAPYTVAFGTLSVGSVTTATQKIWVDIDTNAAQGAFVYAFSNTTGLTSVSTAHTIATVSGDLTGVGEGYGLQIATLAQGSGGPLVGVAPYVASGAVVGSIDTTSRNILSTSGVPITAGRGSILVKAKAAATTPAAGDYASTITMIASGSF